MEEFKLIYKINKNENHLRILGEKFFNCNRLKFRIIYNNKNYNFKELIPIKDIKDDKLIIKIIFFENIENKSSMFEECTSLLTISQNKIANKKDNYIPKITINKRTTTYNDSLKFGENYIEKLSNPDKIKDDNSDCFANNNNLLKYFNYNNGKEFFEISEVSKEEPNSLNYTIKYWKNNLNFNKNRNINFRRLFYNCSSLESLPDLSKWNRNYITRMDGMFYNCNKLSSLPDISNWNTEKCIYMNKLFCNCSSLKILPDISKWKTNYVIDMSGMFSNCSSLISLPDLSKWDVDNVKNMSEIFMNCSSLTHLPGIFTWKTNNAINMSCMFYNCCSLLYLPDISVWKTNNVTDMSGMFLHCTKLLSLPDISKWDTNKVVNITAMFANCLSLSSIPDIHNKWNINKITDKFLMFMNCPQLSPTINLDNSEALILNNFVEIFYYYFSLYFFNIKNTKMWLEFKSVLSGSLFPEFYIDYYNYLTKIATDYESIYSKGNKQIIKANKNIIKYSMIYKASTKTKKIRILGKDFVKINKNKGKIIYKNHKFSLKEEISIEDSNELLKVQLILINNISDLSCMFKDCNSLISFEEIGDIYNNSFEEKEYLTEQDLLFSENYIKVDNIKVSKNNCYSNLYMMFYKCESLVSLPDISNWNTRTLKI